LFQYGLNEGRTFSPFLDLNYYRSNNGDLSSLNNRQLLDHFYLYGSHEDRRFSPTPYNISFGFGLVNASAAVAQAFGQSPFPDEEIYFLASSCVGGLYSTKLQTAISVNFNQPAPAQTIDL
jgi:hypothetical protein